MRPNTGLYVVTVLSLVLLMGSIPFSETIAQTENPNGSPLPGMYTNRFPNNTISTVPGGPGFVSINGLAFVSNYVEGIVGHSGTALFNPNSYDRNYYAPVHLPNGATVKKLVLYYYDISSSDVYAYLNRERLTDHFTETMTATISSGNTGTNWTQNDQVLYPLVDLQNYNYYISVRFPAGTYYDLVLLSVRIDYEYPGYLPCVVK